MRIISIVIFCLVLTGCAKKPREVSGDSDSVMMDPGKSAGPMTESTAEGSDDEVDCIFDLSTQTDDFVKAVKEFKNYTWNDTTKTATILLENGDTLYAQRGGCNHFTYSGKLVTRASREVLDTAFWLSKGKWIADRVFRNFDKELVDSLVSNHLYTVYNQEGNLYVVFEGDHGYSEFYQFTKRRGEWVETEILFYMD